MFCNTKVGLVDLNVRNTGIFTDFFINSFKGKNYFFLLIKFYIYKKNFKR